MGSNEIAAIVLAAGYSKRMGLFKPLLDLYGQPVIVRVVDTFVRAGVCDVRVVVGHNRDALIPVLEKLGTRVIINADYAHGMFTSVLAGVKNLEPAVKSFFVLPADMPLIQPSTIRCLADTHGDSPEKILLPCYDGHSGHPPLVPSKFKEHILSYRGEGGLSCALRQFESETVMMPVADRNILLDMNMQDDYVELLKNVGCRSKGS